MWKDRCVAPLELRRGVQHPQHTPLHSCPPCPIISLLWTVVVRTALSIREKIPTPALGIIQLQASPDPKLTPSFCSTLGSCNHTRPSTNKFYNSDFASG